MSGRGYPPSIRPDLPISDSYQLTTNERVSFLLTGIAESVLFLLSIAGCVDQSLFASPPLTAFVASFVGVVARKQSFVMLYTYFLYVHFVLNIIVGTYFLVTVRKSNRQQIVDYCASVFAGTSAESNCTGLSGISTSVFIVIVVVLLLLELCESFTYPPCLCQLVFFPQDGTVVATRYVYHLRMQKKDGRSRRLGFFHALSAPPFKHTCQPSDNIELLHPRDSIASYSTVPYVDPYDIEDRTFDIDMPSTNLDAERGHSAQPSRLTASSDGSARRIRALPPRPSANSALDVLTRPPRTRSDLPLAQEMVSPDGEVDPDSPYTVELSTTAHSALMDHAAYMRPVFSSSTSPDSPPPYSGPPKRLRLGKRS